MQKKLLRWIRFDDLRSFCQQAYMKVGVPDEEASIVASFLAMSDLRGIETHGVTRLPIYIQRLQKGYVRAECQLTYLPIHQEYQRECKGEECRRDSDARRTRIQDRIRALGKGHPATVQYR